ncbi:nucleoside diphosphate kinase 2, chloroplastic-like isoform X1 [Miscanthus floridulus]|uniref:nucleoside diphosphate kinase 2, chloroplastic-like isoform X1 n=1 Tax=Miscanthus floridulus TaxID=154761 RepID=UPI0034591A54
METMAALARTAPPLAGSTRRPSCALRPTASLSFGAASTTPRGRLGLGLSTASPGSVRAARARTVPRRIVSSSEVEQSYIMIKPDGVQRGLVGDIISRFEKKGFLLKGLKLFQCPKDLAQVCFPKHINVAELLWILQSCLSLSSLVVKYISQCYIFLLRILMCILSTQKYF